VRESKEATDQRSVQKMRLISKKSPAPGRGFLFIACRPYRLRPEPGPVGVNVDPLGEPEGASVFPDGFVVVLGPVRVPPAIPVVEPGGRAIDTGTSARRARAAAALRQRECA
jgi:hypothetical protein